MKFASLLSCALGVLALSGCQTNQRVSVHPDDMTPAPKPNSGLPVEPAPDPTKATTPEAGTSETTPEKPEKPRTPAQIARDKMKETAAAAVQPIKVATPGSDRWQKAPISIADFAKKVDGAIAGLKGVAGGFEMDLRNAQLQGTQAGQFLIADPTIYRIDFADVDHPTGVQRYQANGKTKSVRLSDGKLVTSPLSKSPGAGKPSTADFYRYFSKIAFEALAESRPTWVPLMEQFRQQGYKQSLEIKEMNSGGVMRPYYRLLMSRKGIGLNAFEARFDGIRFVPLTMKMNATDAKQRPITAEWRGEWHFNQSVKEAILHPESANKPKTP